MIDEPKRINNERSEERQQVFLRLKNEKVKK